LTLVSESISNNTMNMAVMYLNQEVYALQSMIVI